MEALLEETVLVTDTKKKLGDDIVIIPWADVACTYFHRNPKWLYDKLDGRGEEPGFTGKEIEQLRSALVDLSARMRKIAEKI